LRVPAEPNPLPLRGRGWCPGPGPERVRPVPALERVLMAYATAEDISARAGRPLAPEELAEAEAYLEDAEARILARIPDALEKAANADSFAGNLVSVECAVALRAPRLADGVQLTYPTDPSGTHSPQATAGDVAVRRSEWRQLGATRGAFYW